MKILVVHRRDELYQQLKAFCETTSIGCFRGLVVEYARDTNAKRYGNFEKYVQRMELDGPEWSEPDAEVLKKVRDADILLTEWGAISSKVIAAGERLKLIATIRSGCENINVAFAQSRGIEVSISPSRLAEPVADMTVALMLSEVRGIVRRNLRANEGEWVEEKYDDGSHCALCNLRIGLIGYGGIARVVAKRLVNGFGCEVVAYEQITPPELLLGDGVQPVEMEELLKTSDIISVHGRLVPQTRHMVGREQFAMMKKNAILINTARAGLVDEQALIEALQKGVIRGAGLDVYETEPLPLDSPLLQMDNVTLMPHSSGITNDIIKNSLRIINKELERFLMGEKLDFNVKNVG